MLVVAIVQYGHGISRISGKIGGAVHSRTAYNFALRSLPTRTVRVSSFQQKQRTNLSPIALAWAALSEDKRAEWNTFAGFYASWPNSNPTRQLSGYHVFLELNNNLHLIGDSGISDPPWTAKTLTFLWDDHLITDGGIRFTIRPDTPAGGWYPYMRFTPSLSPGIQCIEKFLRYVPLQEIDSETFLFTDTYAARFGSAPVFDKLVCSQCCFISGSSGYRSNSVATRDIVVHPIG